MHFWQADVLVFLGFAILFALISVLVKLDRIAAHLGAAREITAEINEYVREFADRT